MYRGQPPNFLTFGEVEGDVDGEAGFGCLFVRTLHVFACLAHSFDDLVEAHTVFAVAVERESGCGDRLDRTHGVSLDARNLHQTGNGIAGES